MADSTPLTSLKDLLQREREELRARHAGGALGGQIATALSDLYDRVLAAAYQEAAEQVPAVERAGLLRDLALVAVGGYGRRDLAPFSDIDLLFLTSARPAPAVQKVINAMVRNLWDYGVKLSHSVRSASGCVGFAAQDLPMRTSLTETRFLAGSQSIFSDLQRRIHRMFLTTPMSRFINAVLRERAKEHEDYFATVNLLEPNVKKSPGGLRDIHLLRWIALPRYGTREPEMLRVGGVLTAQDAHALSVATEFLSRIRNELHFHAGAAQDVLRRDEQVRVAKWLGFENQGALLGVERFMQHYYRQTTALHDLVMRFAEGARRGSAVRRIFNRLLTRREEGHFLISRDSVSIDPQAGKGVLDRAEVLLRLFDLARNHGLPVAHETLERVRSFVPGCEVSNEARQTFLRMMSDPQGLGLLVRDLHRIGLLGRFIPAFEHARCLMQWNQYHKYTVDEHSIRALEAATWRIRDDGPVGQAYRETKRKDVLHLAVLLHDIGKGYEEDHSEVGKRIAETLASEVGLGEHERTHLVYLVHKHLVMAHTAQRRDISDMATIVQFVRSVGTVETLRMLYVLTLADTEAVAPGSLTDWKESLLTELYLRSMEELTGTSPVANVEERLASMRRSLEEKLQSSFPVEWLRGQLATLPLSYFQTTAPEAVASHLKLIQAFDPKGVRVDSQYSAETGLTEYTVIVRDDLTPGIFSKISGVLASERFQIVGAQIVTRADGLVMDTFRGVDFDFKGAPPAHRRNDVARRIEHVLLGRETVESLFAARHGTPGYGVSAARSGQPAQVEVDTSTSDRCTILEVFADDRLGLLYDITRTLFDAGLSIASAKISTSLDQIVDVFYVTDRSGAKVTDEARLEGIRKKLLAVIEGGVTESATQVR